jgi:predicted dehydrogenase
MDSSTTRLLRAGVIGCGVGRSHIRGYVAANQVEVVALAGLDEARCQAASQEYNIPHVYRDYQDLLARDDLDMVSIAVPNYLHREVTLAALECGLHVCVEKPLAHTVEDAAAIAAAADTSNKQVMVMFNWRFRSDAQALRRYVDTGALGRVYYAKAGWVRRSGIPGIGAWFTQKSLSGGGPLIDLGVHMLDLSLWLLGYPQAVAVTGATYAEFGPRGRGGWSGRFEVGAGGYEVEDLATAFIRLANGTTLLLEASWASHSHFKDDFYVHLFGADGGAEMNVREYTEVDTLTFYHEVAGVPAETRPVVTAGHAHSLGIREFVEAIREGRPNHSPADQGLQLMRIIDGIYRSAASSAEVRL